jgi:hypothetical protein
VVKHKTAATEGTGYQVFLFTIWVQPEFVGVFHCVTSIFEQMYYTMWKLTMQQFETKNGALYPRG